MPFASLETIRTSGQEVDACVAGVALRWVTVGLILLSEGNTHR